MQRQRFVYLVGRTCVASAHPFFSFFFSLPPPSFQGQETFFRSLFSFHGCVDSHPCLQMLFSSLFPYSTVKEGDHQDRSTSHVNLSFPVKKKTKKKRKERNPSPTPTPTPIPFRFFFLLPRDGGERGEEGVGDTPSSPPPASPSIPTQVRGKHPRTERDDVDAWWTPRFFFTSFFLLLSCVCFSTPSQGKVHECIL